MLRLQNASSRCCFAHKVLVCWERSDYRIARNSDRELKESTVRTWANQYRKELATRKKEGKHMTVVKLVSKKSSSPTDVG